MFEILMKIIISFLFIDSKNKEQKIKDTKKSSDRESKQVLLSGSPVSIIYFLFYFICKVHAKMTTNNRTKESCNFVNDLFTFYFKFCHFVLINLYYNVKYI